LYEGQRRSPKIEKSKKDKGCLLSYEQYQHLDG